MTRLSIVALPALLLAACTAQTSSPSGELLRATTEIAGVNGLERLEANGPFLAGTTERFKLHVDEAQISQATFSASAGTLTTSGRTAEWTLPSDANAELTVALTRRDGTTDTASWSFRLTRAASSTGTQTAEQALLTTPMPVLDGGTIEVSGGSCEVRYEGTSTNVALAFTTETHPALMYGRWNGSAWALEVVDAMGFNTGGVVKPYVSMQVEANGTPHIAYVRESTVMYATKVAGNWVRERVDNTTSPYSAFSSNDKSMSPSIALNGTTPVVLYTTGTSTNTLRAVISTRTGANAWTTAVVVPPGLNSSYQMSPMGELVIDSAGRHLFPMYAVDTTPAYTNRLVAWTSTATTSIVIPTITGRTDTAIVSPTRMLFRTSQSVVDVALNATFTSSTWVQSNVESTGGSDEGDLVWNASQSKPVVLHLHSSSLELVTPNAAGFWTYQQLGNSSGASAGLAVNPTSGEVSICYQANSRIMFQ